MFCMYDHGLAARGERADRWQAAEETFGKRGQERSNWRTSQFRQTLRGLIASRFYSTIDYSIE